MVGQFLDSHHLANAEAKFLFLPHYISLELGHGKSIFSFSFGVYIFVIC